MSDPSTPVPPDSAAAAPAAVAMQGASTLSAAIQAAAAQQGADAGAVDVAPTAPAGAAHAAPASPDAPKRYVNPYAAKAAASPATTPAGAVPAAPAVPAESTARTPADPRLAALESEVVAMRQALGATATQQMQDLPEAARKAVEDLAGEDPVHRLKVLASLRRHGMISTPLPVGATTAPSATAPTASALGDADAQALTTYEKLQAQSPTIALMFRAAHADEIERAQARKTARN